MDPPSLPYQPTILSMPPCHMRLPEPALGLVCAGKQRAVLMPYSHASLLAPGRLITAGDSEITCPLRVQTVLHFRSSPEAYAFLQSHNCGHVLYPWPWYAWQGAPVHDNVSVEAVYNQQQSELSMLNYVHSFRAPSRGIEAVSLVSLKPLKQVPLPLYVNEPQYGPFPCAIYPSARCQSDGLQQLQQQPVLPRRVTSARIPFVPVAATASPWHTTNRQKLERRMLRQQRPPHAVHITAERSSRSAMHPKCGSWRLMRAVNPCCYRTSALTRRC